jgi:hypothetical protein
MIDESDPAGVDAIPVGQDESRRQRLVGIFLIGHDHQDVSSDPDAAGDD